jgi:hypothetical protein
MFVVIVTVVTATVITTIIIIIIIIIIIALMYSIAKLLLEQIRNRSKYFGALKITCIMGCSSTN